MVEERYQIIIDDEFECYKIIDTQSIIGSEDTDFEEIAHVFESNYAEYICGLLNQFSKAAILG